MTKENIVTLHNAYSILSLSNNPTLVSDDKEHVIVQLSKLVKAVADTKQKRLQQQANANKSRAHSDASERARNYFWKKASLEQKINKQ